MITDERGEEQRTDEYYAHGERGSEPCRSPGTVSEAQIGTLGRKAVIESSKARDLVPIWRATSAIVLASQKGSLPASPRPVLPLQTRQVARFPDYCSPSFVAGTAGFILIGVGLVLGFTSTANSRILVSISS